MKKFEEKKLVEMAQIDQIEDLIIQVYTDHDPIHFHVIKKDKFEVRVSLKDLSILSYKWQKNGAEISKSDIQKIIIWLDQKNKKQKLLSNRQAIEFAWRIMNL